MENGIIQKAFAWIERQIGEGFLDDSEYCSNRDIFQARLDHLRIDLERVHVSEAPLLIAVLGEIGNNAYDHNLGNWRDIPGTYFVAGVDERVFVIADRGQGIRTTIAKIKPEIKNDQDALLAAFTERISGRSPEQRGNGLKFVKSIVEQFQWKLECYSGKAVISISVQEVKIKEYPNEIEGCITIIRV